MVVLEEAMGAATDVWHTTGTIRIADQSSLLGVMKLCSKLERRLAEIRGARLVVKTCEHTSVETRVPILSRKAHQTALLFPPTWHHVTVIAYVT